MGLLTTWKSVKGKQCFYVHKENVLANTNIPIELEKPVRKTLKSVGYSCKELDDTKKKRRHLTYNTFYSIYSDLPDQLKENECIRICRYLLDNYFFDKISDIRYVGEEDTYCLEMSNGLFVQNGILGKNSQGSQFNHVILGVDFSAYSLLTRELLYTGITRAKKKCDLVAQTGALRMAISKEGVSKKQTHLQQCLHDLAHPKLVF